MQGGETLAPPLTHILTDDKFKTRGPAVLYFGFVLLYHLSVSGVLTAGTLDKYFITCGYLPCRGNGVLVQISATLLVSQQRLPIIVTQVKGIFNISLFNILKPTGHYMYRQFNIQQLYALPTLYLCVLYLSEKKQRLVPLTA